MSKAIPKLKLNDKVEVRWHDAHDCEQDGKTWLYDGEEVMEIAAYECLSMGYFLKRENGFIYIAGDLLGIHFSRVFAIPEGCVREVNKL